MPAYVIQYDLHQGDRSDYEDLYAALENAKAVRATESTWFLTSRWNAIQIRDWLKKYLHKKDRVGVNVLAVGNGWASDNLLPGAVAWINRNLKAKSLYKL